VKYRFGMGNKIKCRTIKFSSKGVWYLEPEHPVYQTEMIYSFEIIRIESAIETSGNVIEILTITDCFHNEIYLKTNSQYDLSSCLSVNCKVVDFNKGIPVLSLV
jgi:hypothetical protein